MLIYHVVIDQFFFLNIQVDLKIELVVNSLEFFRFLNRF